MRAPLGTTLVLATLLGAVAAGSLDGSGRAASAAPAAQLEVLSHVDPGGGISGDVFGYKGHAYLGSWRGTACPALGVRVYDVRAPRQPRLVSSFADAKSEPLVAGSWTEKVVVQPVRTARFRGDLAVTSIQACRRGAFEGYGLYDVTDPTQPKQLALVRTELPGSHEIWLQPRGAKAYVYTAIPQSELRSSPDYDPQTRTATTPGPADFRIIDVSDPRRPVQVGEWGAWRNLRINPKDGRGRFVSTYVHSVIVNKAATRAFLSYWDAGTVILDISKPASPRYLGRTRVPGDPEGDIHSAALGKDGKLLVETHEHGDSLPHFFDISNPKRPRYIRSFRIPGEQALPGVLPYYTDGVHDPKVRGNVAYFSWYRRGLAVVDITKTTKPRLLARFVPPAAADPGGACGGSPACTMVWGVFPHTDYILVSDMASGLWVLRLRR